MTRKFGSLIAALAIFAAAGAAQAKQDMPLVGLLGGGKASAHASRYAAFREKMADLGHLAGRNIRFVYRYAEGDNSRLPALAAELVGLGVDVIVSTGTLATLAARNASRAVPIVMHTGYPVRSGLVASLARPGGNVTGVTVNSGPEIYCKRLEILTEAVPLVRRLGVLFVPSNQVHEIALNTLKRCAGEMDTTILPLAVDKPADIEGALATMKRRRASAFFQFGSSLFSPSKKRMIAFALENRLPYMCKRARYIRQGCLISYGANLHDLNRRMALYVDKILKGADPAEMPVEQPIKYDLAVNLKTAKALGIAFPPSILLRATEVFE